MSWFQFSNYSSTAKVEHSWGTRWVLITYPEDTIVEVLDIHPGIYSWRVWNVMNHFSSQFQLQNSSNLYVCLCCSICFSLPVSVCVYVCLSYCMQKHCVLLETYKIDKDLLSHGAYFWVGNSIGSRNREEPVCLEQSKRMGGVTDDIKERSGAPSCRTFLVIWGLILSSEKWGDITEFWAEKCQNLIYVFKDSLWLLCENRL